MEEAIQSMRESLWRCKGNPSIANSQPAALTPQARCRSAHFDFLFSTILDNFLDGATKQVQDGGRAMCEALASICAAIARSPIERSNLRQVALESIPFPIKEAFGSPPWSWQAVGYMDYLKETTETSLNSVTGVYAYHLTKINKRDEQNFYVGQTTKNFVDRFWDHARHRKAHKRPKNFSSKLYGNLKLTRPRDINIYILADISVLQEDILAHKVMATILEAGFCVFFDTIRPSKLPGSDESMSFALRWLVISPLVGFLSHLLTSSPSRPTEMPAVPWPGLNFAFPLFQDILLRPWLEEEVEILDVPEREWDPELAQKTLAEAGFQRSLSAILSKRRSLYRNDCRRA